MKRKIWKVKELSPQANELAKEYNIFPITAQLLLNRDTGEKEITGFLNPALSYLHSPSLLPDIDKAVERIKKAVGEKEKILIFGDYDVDGITSLAIFYEFIKEFPGIFSFYIPHRTKDGYGLNTDAIEEAGEKGVSLIVAFDCGTNAFPELELAHSLGIDVIVVDHHQPKESLPKAYAFINPKRKDSSYPFSDLSSAALSFKLLQALKGAPCWDVLDLVALSLVCDIVPLKGENRILIKEGLKRLKKSDRVSIKTLCQVSSVKQQNLDIFHIGYILGPRINASGRVAHAQESLDIFLTDDEKKAYSLAIRLQEHNKLRRDIEGFTLKEAEQKAEEFIDDYAIVVHDEGWHPGVLGIVASRLADKYYRPSFVISFDQNLGKGSARSIHSVHLAEVLEKCSKFLHTYGGHQKAAGIQIFKEELDNFKEKINLLIKEKLKPEDFIPILDVDLRINFKDINIALIDELERLKPFGEDNPEPLFVSYNILKKSSPKKIKGGYSLWLSDGTMTLEGIVYDRNILEIVDYGENLDVVYSLTKNNYYNEIRLIIKDCQLSGGKS